MDESKSFNWPEGLQIERIAVLETGEENLISFFRKLIVSPNEKLFYIVDQSQGKILVFENPGKAMGILARQGEGPEEYLQMTDAQIDFEAGIIEVMDYLKIEKYDLETLQYIGTENLNNLPGDKNFRNFARIGEALYQIPV